MLSRVVIATCLAVFAASSPAATISGQVTSAGTGSGLVGYQVLVFGLTAKGWSVSTSTSTGGGGSYSVTVGPGDYLVRAAPANTTDQCLLARRYYDVAAPFANGRLESAADVITLASAGSVVTGINLPVPTVGGIDGRVTQSTTGLNGMLVRVEEIADPQVFVEAFTSSVGGVPGFYSACGVDPGSHRIRVHSPTAQHEDFVAPGPFVVTSGARGTVATLSVVPIGTDPNEPNASVATGSPVPAILDAWISTSSIITPRGSDADFYCLDAVAGESYVVTTDTSTVIAGEPRQSPWVDPQVGWYSQSPAVRLAVNDDDPLVPGSRNARIATEPVSADGRYCVGVTTYGDADFNGSGQGSAGRYSVRVALVIDAMFADGFEQGLRSVTSR